MPPLVTDGTRPIFLHIPKTAGITMRYMFIDRYPWRTVYSYDFPYGPERARWRYVRGETDEWPFDPDGNRDVLGPWRALTAEERARYTAFLGHFWFGVHDELPKPNTYVTILRDPVERLLSMHAFRRQENGFPVPLDRFVRERRDFEIDNGQTLRLSSAGPVSGPRGRTGRVTQTMLDVAMETLSTRCAAVGVTERFDETALAFARALGWTSLGYRYSNRTRERLYRDDVDAGLIDTIVECNQFDQQLHAFADELLTRSLAGVDVASERRRLERESRSLRIRKVVQRRVYRVRRAGSRVKQRLRRT